MDFIVHQLRLPGVVLVSEGHRANTLADEVDGEGQLEVSFHRTRLEVQLLKKTKV